MGLHLDFGVGDTIRVGDVQITLQEKTGRRARVTIDADADLPISLKSAGRDEKVFSGGREKTAHECSTNNTLREVNTHGPDSYRGQ